MDQRTRDEGLDRAEQERVIVRRPLWARIAMYLALGILVLLVLALIALWIERRPIATHVLKNEFEKRGVTAKYHLDRVGFRTRKSAISLSAIRTARTSSPSTRSSRCA